MARRPALLTADDYARLPEDLRAELIDGMLVMNPSPDLRHQTIVLHLVRALDRHLGAAADMRLFVSLCDVFLDDHNVLQPDVLVLPKRAPATARRTPLPALVIEVISPSTETRDRGVKLERYRARGVQEAWVVDGYGGTIEAFDFTTGTSRVSGPGDIARSTALPGFSIEVTPHCEF